MLRKQINVNKLITELWAYGNLSDETIGKRVGLATTTVWRIRKGIHRSTRVECGIKIANLHSRIFKKSLPAPSAPVPTG